MSFDLLSPRQIDGAIDLCMNQALGLIVTVHREDLWATYRSQIVAKLGKFLWIAHPKADNGADNGEFPQEEQLGLSFLRGPMRYMFSVTVVGQEPYIRDDETEQMALKVTFPESMHRAERRVEDRLDLPASAAARAMLWLGGRDRQPAKPTADTPMWSGRMMDISNGGACIRVTAKAAACLNVGDLVGFRMTFDYDVDNAIVMDATLRHTQEDGEMVLMGFQFVEGDFSPRTVEAFEALREKLGLFG